MKNYLKQTLMVTPLLVMILVLLAWNAKLVRRQTEPALLLSIEETSLYKQAAQSIEFMQPKNSSARNKLITRMIASIASEVFSETKHAEYWIALIGVESGYNPMAKSSVGAIGLGQLLPQYYLDFGKSCGLGDVDKADLSDAYTNAYLSACYFRYLIELNDGSIPLALVSYNAGANSLSLQRAKSVVSPNPESAGHATKVWVLRDKANK